MVEEIFGFILLVILVYSFVEVIEVVNVIDYGFVVLIFLVNGKWVLCGVWMLCVGIVIVNSFGEGDILILFGGYK